MTDFRVIVGDCIEGMRSLPDQSVHTCVTSPPYFGLRDYGMAGQIGLEDTPDAFVARLVDVFREVRRVLRDDGTLWLNLGDSYAAQRGGSHPPAETLAGGKGGKTADGANVNRDRHDGYNPTRNASGIGLKHKDLIGIPWRVAFALQADGWYLRQDIIWHKPNPMPESVTDRCTKAHEYVFLLSKSARYFYDADAIKEPANLTGKGNANGFRGGAYVNNATFDNSVGGKRTSVGNTKQAGHGRRHAGFNERYDFDKPPETRNRRSVWTVATKPYAGAHFATFPPDLIEPCILAGSPVGGTVLDPFGGSGTTAGVAMRNGRSAILCELNPEYAALMPERIAALGGNQGDLFRSAAQ